MGIDIVLASLTVLLDALVVAAWYHLDVDFTLKTFVLLLYAAYMLDSRDGGNKVLRSLHRQGVIVGFILNSVEMLRRSPDDKRKLQEIRPTETEMPFVASEIDKLHAPTKKTSNIFIGWALVLIPAVILIWLWPRIKQLALALGV